MWALKALTHTTSSRGPSSQVPLSSAIVPSTIGSGSAIMAPFMAGDICGTTVVGSISMPFSASSNASFELPAPASIS